MPNVDQRECHIVTQYVLMKVTRKRCIYVTPKIYADDKECVREFVNTPAVIQLLTDGEYRAVLSSILIISSLRTVRLGFIKDQLAVGKD